MISAVPAATAERKKSIGSIGDHHSALSLSGMSRKMEPSELWCIVESTTAAIASITGIGFSPSRWRNLMARAAKMTYADSDHGKLRDQRYGDERVTQQAHEHRRSSQEVEVFSSE